MTFCLNINRFCFFFFFFSSRRRHTRFDCDWSSDVCSSDLEFYQGPMSITMGQWDTAMNSQAKAFLLAVREVCPLMGDDGRIIAITYAPGGRTGSWQPWVGMGAAKVAMGSLCRYFAVSRAKRGITVNAISPGWIEGSVLNTPPDAAQDMIRTWHQGGWTPMGRLGTPADN